MKLIPCPFRNIFPLPIAKSLKNAEMGMRPVRERHNEKWEQGSPTVQTALIVVPFPFAFYEQTVSRAYSNISVVFLE